MRIEAFFLLFTSAVFCNPICTLNTQYALAGTAYKLVLSQDETTMYIARTGGGLTIAQINNGSSSLSILGEYLIPNGTAGDVILTQNETLAFVSLGFDGIHAVDVNLPSDLFQVAEVPFYPTSYFFRMALSADEKTLFAAAYGGGLFSFDVSNVRDNGFNLISNFVGAEQFGGTGIIPLEVHVLNPDVLIVVTVAGLFTFRADNLAIIDSFIDSTGETPLSAAVDIPNGLIYVSTNIVNFWVLNVSDNGTLAFVSAIPYCGAPLNPSLDIDWAVAAVGSYVVSGFSIYGIQNVDVSNVNSPQLDHFLSVKGGCRGLTFTRDLNTLYCVGDSLSVIDSCNQKIQNCPGGTNYFEFCEGFPFQVNYSSPDVSFFCL